MNQVEVRKAREGDLKAVQDLNYQLFVHDSQFEPELNMDWPYREGEEYFKRRIQGEDGVCLVAEMGDQIAGYLAGGIRGGEDWLKVLRSEIENMFVLKEFRKAGVGRILVEEFKQWSQEKGAKRVVVNAFWGNIGSIEFYKKIGFESYDISLELKI